MQWLFHHYLTGSALGFVSLHINVLLLKSTTAAWSSQLEVWILLTGLCNSHVTLWKKPVFTMDDTILSDLVILCIFLLAQTVNSRLPCLAQGHFSRVDVCEQRTHDPSAAWDSLTTRPPWRQLKQLLCQKAYSFSFATNLKSPQIFVISELSGKLADETIEGCFGNKLQAWHIRTSLHRICFAGLDWNFSENAVYVKSAWVCLSALGVLSVECICVSFLGVRVCVWQNVTKGAFTV